MSTTKLTLFMVNKDEWYTKEGCAKSMKKALFVQWYGKRHLSGSSDVEQQKNQARSLSHFLVTWVWRHQAGSSQSVSQSVENSFFFFKFCSNFLKAFRINLKAFLGLVLPNQYCHIIMLGILAGFKVDFLRGAPPQSSTSLLWTTIVVYDTMGGSWYHGHWSFESEGKCVYIRQSMSATIMFYFKKYTHPIAIVIPFCYIGNQISCDCGITFCHKNYWDSILLDQQKLNTYYIIILYFYNCKTHVHEHVTISS